MGPRSRSSSYSTFFPIFYGLASSCSEYYKTGLKASLSLKSIVELQMFYMIVHSWLKPSFSRTVFIKALNIWYPHVHWWYKIHFSLFPETNFKQPHYYFLLKGTQTKEIIFCIHNSTAFLGTISIFFFLDYNPVSASCSLISIFKFLPFIASLLISFIFCILVCGGFFFG